MCEAGVSVGVNGRRACFGACPLLQQSLKPQATLFWSVRRRLASASCVGEGQPQEESLPQSGRPPLVHAESLPDTHPRNSACL